MKHLGPAELSRRLDGTLDARARAEVDRHLEQCASCREALAAWAAQDQALKQALDHDPGEAYFDTFAARVEDRLRSAGLSGAQSRVEGGFFAWLRSPSRLAWVGAVAAVVAGAGIVILSSREVERPVLDHEISGRIAQVAPPAAPQGGGQGGAPARAEESRAPSDEKASDREDAARTRARPAPAPATGTQAAPGVGDLRGPQSEAKLQREATEAKSATAAPSPAPFAGAPSAKGTPDRLQAARRNVQGEDVPLGKESFRFAMPPTPTASAPEPGASRALKAEAATPLRAESQSPAGERSNEAVQGESSLCGRVLDPSGRPVAGAQVALADDARTAVTDANGRFCIATPPGDHDLAVMAVGFQNSRAPVRVAGESSEVTVTLQPVSVLGRGFAMRPAGPQEQVSRGAPESRGADAFAGLPADVRAAVDRAGRLSARAAERRSAPEFDAAARAWQALGARVGAGSAGTAARLALASARFEAWRIEPSPARARTARAAVTAYLEVAPEGADRDRARRWQAALGR